MKTNTLIDYKFSNEGAEPVTLSEAKASIKVPAAITSDDTLITQLITAARKKIEMYLGISLVSRTVDLYMDINNCEPADLPFGPVTAVTEITNSDDETVDADNYKVVGLNNKQLDYPNAGKVTITFTTAGASDAEYKTYILRQVAWLYENRGDDKDTRLQPSIAQELKSKRRFLI